MYDYEADIEYLFATHMFSIKQQIKALKDTDCYLFDFNGRVWYKGKKVADDFNSFIIQKRKENEPKIRERQAKKQATEDYIAKQRESNAYGKLRLELIAKKVCDAAGLASCDGSKHHLREGKKVQAASISKPALGLEPPEFIYEDRIRDILAAITRKLDQKNTLSALDYKNMAAWATELKGIVMLMQHVTKERLG